MESSLLERAAGQDAGQGEKQEQENGTFVCDVEGCDRSFKTKQAFAVHQSKTHGIKGKARRPGGQRSRRKTSTATARKPATLNETALIKLICPGGQAPAPMVPEIAAWVEEAHEIFEACQAAGPKRRARR